MYFIQNPDPNQGIEKILLAYGPCDITSGGLAWGRGAVFPLGEAKILKYPC